jgi:hypothetical protein
MSKITYKHTICEITYKNKNYITGKVSIKNNKDIGIYPYVCNKPIDKTWVHDMLDTTSIIAKNDFFGMYITYDSKEGFATKDTLDISNIMLTIDKNILVLDDLILFINNISDIDLLTYGFTRINIFFFIYIYCKYNSINVDLKDGYTTNILEYTKQLKDINVWN